MKVRDFGKLPDGREASLFIMENKNGASASVTNVGASIVSIFVPDKNGKLEDVVLGYDCAEKYLSKGAYHGATVGRVANRIEDAWFELEGVRYELKPNYIEYYRKEFWKYEINRKSENKQERNFRFI